MITPTKLSNSVSDSPGSQLNKRFSHNPSLLSLQTQHLVHHHMSIYLLRPLSTMASISVKDLITTHERSYDAFTAKLSKPSAAVREVKSLYSDHHYRRCVSKAIDSIHTLGDDVRLSLVEPEALSDNICIGTSASHCRLILLCGPFQRHYSTKHTIFRF